MVNKNVYNIIKAEAVIIFFFMFIRRLVQKKFN